MSIVDQMCQCVVVYVVCEGRLFKKNLFLYCNLFLIIVRHELYMDTNISAVS